MNTTRTQLWYLIGSLQVGGANQTLVNLVNNLDYEKYDITIWTILSSNHLESELNDEVDLRVLDASNKYDIFAATLFILEVYKKDPDILQSWNFFDNILGRIASLFSSTKHISGVRAVPEEPSQLRAWMDRLTIPLTDHVISNSKAGRQLAIGRGANPECVSVVENGRNLEKYRSANVPDDLRASLNIPSQVTLVGNVARLIKRKGHYDLLEAWQIVQNEHPDTHLLLVGDGPERDDLESYTQQLDIQRSVTFVGIRDDVPRLLNLMDIFVFPSHFEGLPGALIEAMAVGLPVVATRATGNEELIIDHKSGILVPIRDPHSLANSINHLLLNKSEATNLGERASEVTNKRFSMAKMVSGFENVYKSVLSQQGCQT